MVGSRRAALRDESNHQLDRAPPVATWLAWPKPQPQPLPLPLPLTMTLGVLLYELLDGKTPFDDANPARVQARIMRDAKP